MVKYLNDLRGWIALPYSFEAIQHLISYYRGLCTHVFGQNDRRFHIKSFLNFLNFVVHLVCVCDQYPEQYPSTNLENCPNLPKSRVGAVPTVFGTGHPAKLQPTKTIKKTPVYYPENNENLIFIDRKTLHQ